MLESDLGSLHLALVGLAAELPVELGALSQPRGAQGVALGDETAGGIHDDLSAVGLGTGVDELAALALGTKTQCLVGDQLVAAEAVVELHHVDVLGPEARLLVDLLGGGLGEIGADDLDAALLAEGALEVGGHGLAEDLHGLGLEPVLLDEVLAAYDRGAGAVRGRAALELGERSVDQRGVQDLLEGVLVLELGVRVVDRVLVVLPADLGELLLGGPVPLHVLEAGVAEHLGGAGRLGIEAALLDHHREVLVHGNGPVGVLDAERTLLHLLEAERHGAVDQPALHELLGHEERGGSRRAVVVHVVDRDAGETELVDGALPAGRLAVAVADHRLLDGVIGDTGILQGLGTGLRAHLRVVPFSSSRLLELRHAHADDECLPAHVRIAPLLSPLRKSQVCHSLWVRRLREGIDSRVN